MKVVGVGSGGVINVFVTSLRVGGGGGLENISGETGKFGK